MDRGKDVVLHDPFRDQDGVFVVVSVPGHERDECVPAQSKLTQLGGRTIGNDVTLLDNVTHLHQRTLINTGIQSEEHTSELQSLMRISYAVFCWKKNTNTIQILHPLPPQKRIQL